jgi:hypothetical protein
VGTVGPVGVDPRARSLAGTAAGLAAGAGVALPDQLVLWRLAGGRPRSVAPVASEDPAAALVAAMEAALTADERRRGAHYTPDHLADEVAALAVRAAGAVADPACGAGALLLAAGRRLVALGGAAREVGRDLLWGADLDPLAAAVTEAAIALWSGGTPPAAGHVVAADALEMGLGAWSAAPAEGFAAVVGNPPFQGQLATDTARDERSRARATARFGAAGRGYVDTAALFLLLGVELVAPGGRVALVQPRSVAAARDSGSVRAALAERARLVELHVPEGRPFGGRVHVCVPVLEVGAGAPADWAAALADGSGVPRVDLGGGPALATVADVVAGFRQHYYGLVDHVRDGGDGHRLVTSGLLGVGTSAWGSAPARFAKRRWARPTVVVTALDEPLRRWLDPLLRPKVLVATQTRIVEAAADREGRWVPCTPVLSVVPHDPWAVDRLTAALCAPPVSAWVARRAAGTGLSPGALRLTTTLLGQVPLPVDERRWAAATDALAAGDLDRYAPLATDLYGLDPAVAAEVLAWWRPLASE